MSEPATNQDLKELEGRIDGRFADFEQRVDARFADFEQRVDARFADFEQRMDARFADFEQRMDARFADFEQRADARFADFEQRMDARFAEFRELVTDTETKLLKAFYGFVESNQKRLEGIERDQGNLHERLAILERRVTEVERRLNIPPSA